MLFAVIKTDPITTKIKPTNSNLLYEYLSTNEVIRVTPISDADTNTGYA